MYSAALVCAAIAATSVAQVLPPVPTLQPYNLQGVVDAQQAFAASATLQSPTGLTKADLLQTIASVVEFFRGYQAADGRILDPATGIEEQYSTPHFAFSCAVLIAHAGRSDLLQNASAALSIAIASMANGSAACAQATCDFYALPVMRAVGILSPLVDGGLAAAWESQLQSLQPNKTYELTGQNWELTAAAGEWIRIVENGWGNGSTWTWNDWEARIGRLATINGGSPGGPGGGSGFWNSDGLFQDNWGQDKTSPHAYDVFGNAYTSYLLRMGYGSSGMPGYYASYLGPLMARGIRTRIGFQTPWGEIPVGGRSGQHQWNEMVQCAITEYYAAQAAAAGDATSACQLKRAARLYHASARRWLRPDGALQIVKNWFLNATERWGYESYSFFSQYNNMPAAWLANAYLEADDSIPECAAPADVGGTAFALPYSTFRKVFAMAGGTYVEVMTGADPEYDSTGFYRLQFQSCHTRAAANISAAAPCYLNSLLGPTAAPPLSASQPKGVATSIGSAWWTLAGDPNATVHSLAAQTLQTVLAAIFTPSGTNSPTAGVAFSLQYVLWQDAILVTENYALAAGGGSVSVNVQLSMPGQPALFKLMAAAHAAAASPACSGARYGTEDCPAFFPPSDAAAAAAIATGDIAALRAAAPVAEAAWRDTAPTASPFTAFGVQYPVFTFDGLTNFTVLLPTATDPTLLVYPPNANSAAGEGALQWQLAVAQGHTVSFAYDPANQWVPSRNGVIVPLVATLSPITTANPGASYTLSLVPIPGAA